MDTQFKIVDFETYCKLCKHKDCLESEDPCFDCLDTPVNVYSRKPINFEEERK